jgi:hypothetical protein
MSVVTIDGNATEVKLDIKIGKAQYCMYKIYYWYNGGADYKVIGSGINANGSVDLLSASKYAPLDGNTIQWEITINPLSDEDNIYSANLVLIVDGNKNYLVKVQKKSSTTVLIHDYRDIVVV